MRLALLWLFLIFVPYLYSNADEVRSTISVSDNNPKNGDSVDITINLDLNAMPAPDHMLGSFSLAVTWDPSQFTFISAGNQHPGFIMDVNLTEVAGGVLRLSGASSAGVGGFFQLMSLKMQTIGDDHDQSIISHSYTAMASAVTIRNLLPVLISENQPMMILNIPEILSIFDVSPEYAQTDETVQVSLFFDTSELTLSDQWVGNFATQIQWDRFQFEYTGASTFLNGFSGSVDTSEMRSGVLHVNAVNPAGRTGRFAVLELQFRLTGQPNSVNGIQATFSSLRSALQNLDLLPYLNQKDAFVMTVSNQAPVNSVLVSILVSDKNPAPQDQITMAVNFDLREKVTADSLLGSYSGAIDWDPSVLEYLGYSGLPDEYLGFVNDAQSHAGQILFNGASSHGRSGLFNVLYLNFRVTGTPDRVSTIGLQLSDVTAAITLNDQLPYLIISEANIHVNYFFDQIFRSGANLMGLPLLPDNRHVDKVYPTSRPSSLFIFDDVYQHRDSLVFATGHWLSFYTPETVRVVGQPVNESVYNLDEGWNLISGISADIPLLLLDDPDAIVYAPLFYGWNGAYFIADTFKQGQGYWVYAWIDGIVRLNTSALPKKNPLSDEMYVFDENHPHIRVFDSEGAVQTLYINVAVENAAEKLRYLLPPLPPNNLFDARFRGDYRVSESASGIIRIQSTYYPVMIESESVSGLIYPVQPEIDAELPAGEILNITAGGAPVVLTDATHRYYRIESGETNQSLSLLPDDYQLDQNFPNPFNPSTNIGYALPGQDFVEITVFDLTGRKVITLVAKDQDAGYHRTHWSGRDSRGEVVASGVYFYSLKTGSFQQFRKMILLR